MAAGVRIVDGIVVANTSGRYAGLHEGPCEGIVLQCPDIPKDRLVGDRRGTEEVVEEGQYAVPKPLFVVPVPIACAWGSHVH